MAVRSDEDDLSHSKAKADRHSSLNIRGVDGAGQTIFDCEMILECTSTSTMFSLLSSSSSEVGILRSILRVFVSALFEVMIV